MPSKELVSHKNKIDALLSRIDNYARSDADPDLQGDLTRYACIQVSGYLEKAILYILYEYSKKHSDPRMQRFTYSRLRRFTNATTGKLEKLFEEFDKGWYARAMKQPDFDQIKGSINSLIKERNYIAHGEDSGISLGRIRQYYRDVARIIVFLDQELAV